MAEPENDLTTISAKLSPEALELLDEFRARHNLDRPALLEALILHLRDFQRSAPKVLDAVVRDAGVIQRDRRKRGGPKRGA